MRTETIVESISPSLVKDRAVKSLKWTVLAEIGSRSISPIVTLVLARLLTPEDFGVVGITTIAISFVQIFGDFGLGKTLIQCRDKVEESASIMFWTSLVLSVFIYLLIFVSAPLLSLFFYEPKVVDVLRVLGLQIIFLSLVSVHQALLQRNFRFRNLFLIRLASSTVPGCISIPMAVSGYSVWSLVSGTLAGAVVQVLLFWRLSEWRPKLRYDLQLARQLIGFGRWVVLEGLLGWLIMWGDSVAIAGFLSTYELGMYRVGSTIVNLAFGMLLYNALPVLYTSFCRFDPSWEIKRAYIKASRIFVFASALIGLCVISFSGILSTIAGEKWTGLDVVMMALTASHILTSLTMGIGAEAYRAIGKPDVHPKIMCLASMIYLPVYFGAAHYGLATFVWIRALLSITVGNGLHFFYLHRLLKIDFRDVVNIARAPLLNLSFCLVLFLACRAATADAFVLKILVGMTLLLFFVVITLVSDRRLFADLLIVVQDASNIRVPFVNV